MSQAVRQVWSKAVKHGRQIFQNFGKNGGESGVGETPGEIRILKASGLVRQNDVRSLPRLPFWEAISKRSGSGALAELRRRAALRLTSLGSPAQGGRVSNLALVGFGLAVGSKCYGPVDEHGYNIACHHIKEWFSEQTNDAVNVPSRTSKDLGVEDFHFDSLIGKGCNAVVYSAKLRTETSDLAISNDVIEHGESSVPMETDEGSSDASFVILDSDEEDADLVSMDTESEEVNPINEELDEIKSKACLKETNLDGNLAIKMLFNFDMESNASDILQGVGCEILPAQRVDVSQSDHMWHNGNRVKKKKLSQHPNIVEMFTVFVDRVPNLPGAHEIFPDALPTRLNPDGFGRNATLFLVMKRYQETLQDYLQRTDVGMTTRIMLLTQLTEAVVHLSRNNIAHRDIKSDNILIAEMDTTPRLVLTDFGCCLSQQNESLYLTYPNDYISKGGNAALMAPEISCKQPGFGVHLDYSKSDLWAVGTIAYEIFGMGNPFYRTSKYDKRLDSRTYKDEDLPSLIGQAPAHLNRIVELMTRRNPKQRASGCIVANMLQIILWGPKEWLKAPPSEMTVMKWLGSLAVQCIMSKPDISSVERELKITFLSRVEFEELMTATHLLSSY